MGPLLLRAQLPGATPPPDAPVQTARTELHLEPANSEVYVQALPADSTVVLLVARSKPFSAKVTFFFQRYDKELRLRHEQPLTIPDEFRYSRMCAEGNTVFSLFSSRTVPGRLLVIAYNGKLGEIRSQQFDTKLSREILELKAMEGKLFATVLLADQNHVTALLLDVATGHMQYLAAVYEPLPAQLTFVADPGSRRAEYVLSQTNGRKTRLLLKQLTHHGQLVKSEFVQAESERSLITAQISPPQDTTARLLTGTYSLRDATYAQGLFATDLSQSDGPKAPLRFYDFLRLKHFFDYLKPARQARLRKRTERRLAKAMRPMRWHYRLLLHELLPQPNGGYVLVAEVYYPHYRYNTYGGGFPAPGGFNPSPYAYPSSRVFDGFQTTHVLVCGFDRQGTLLWDNTFVVDNVRRLELQETVRVQTMPDGRVVLAYLDEAKLRYKVVKQAEPSPNDLQVPVKTAAPGVTEKITSTENADLQAWYGCRFIASGYQKVRPAQGPERSVFFLNAVDF
ncbi:hypothetical protein GCM10023185_21830 [Hymenobacter saemangeumensis]|uniref:Uncharacterized protein n=2 Tax=Hymenobacter saemangeumensis TaxID=1084522 RepID=A0ABP8IEN5_9BACT